MTNTNKSVVATPEYQPTADERSAVESLTRGISKPSSALRVSKNGSAQQLVPKHADEWVGYALLARHLGTDSIEFLDGIRQQVANICSKGGEIDERDANFMLSVVKGLQPKDQLEAMLATQMAAVHMATMTSARRLARAETISQLDSAERAFNKLTRTFATQLEALKRYRTGGEQKGTVQHVTVSEGGQAIVANVTQAPSKAH
jgi:hypothetical protein